MKLLKFSMTFCALITLMTACKKNKDQTRSELLVTKAWKIADSGDDKNKNGIIDSIEDTRDLIQELVDKGYEVHEDIAYLEMEDGSHDVPTWARAFPDFFKWAFGKV